MTRGQEKIPPPAAGSSRLLSPRRLELALITAGALAAAGAAHAGVSLPPELAIGLGFFLFFIAPGLFFILLFFPANDFLWLERLALSVALSLGVWAFPGLLAFSREWPLGFCARVELGLLGALAAGAWARALFFPRQTREREPGEKPGKTDLVSLAAVSFFLLLAAFWTGAFRGEFLDWDYYNYISALRKLMAWNAARNAHPIYLDAPADPIHSYNIWALNFALIGKSFGLDAIALYLRSAFLTVPLSALAFYAFARRALPREAARSSFFLYVSYHVVYGGLLFLGRTTLYPGDSQWLLVFPACLALLAAWFERGGAGVLVGLALAALGMSVVHVLWGLSFYLVAGGGLLHLLLVRRAAGEAFRRGFQEGRRGLLVGSLLVFLFLPALAAIRSLLMAFGFDRSGREPLFSFVPDLPAGLWFFLFVFLPAMAAFFSVRPWMRKREEAELARGAGRLLKVLLLAGLLALPYALLRLEAVSATNWARFGRNPYRAFIFPGLFFLNPFKLSLANPNMTFYPLYVFGFVCLPFFRRMTRERQGSLLAWSALIIPLLICFHPALATLFAEHFSLGYLRRLLRLLALASAYPAGAGLCFLAGVLVKGDARPWLRAAGEAGIAAVLCALFILAPASPWYYNRLLGRTLHITLSYPRDSLLQDDRPFRAIAGNRWFQPGEVIFSDFWTSYRLTAYLPLFVAVQAKPGVGVADQDERMALEAEFFAPATPLSRMKEILSRFHAAGVIVNRSPAYKLMGIACGHPEAAGKMKGDPRSFQVLYDRGDWVIFRYLPAKPG